MDRILRHADLAVAVVLAFVAVLARGLDGGSLLRLVLTLPFLLLVPGYLLLQTVRPHGDRRFHAVAGIGISLPVVGLLALLTSVARGGFTATAIVTTTTVGVAVMAAIALAVRVRSVPAPDAATTAVEA